MSAPIYLVETPVIEGCVTCHTQLTVILHPHHGRQCPDCVTLPPGPFDRGLAEDMTELGRPDAAFRYLAVWLTRECDARFRRAVQAVTG